VFVWRADARTADITGARISRDTMFEWSAASFSGLKESFKKKVPDDVYRAAPLARIELRLDPEKPLNEEKQMAEHWEELQAAPPRHRTFTRQRWLSNGGRLAAQPRARPTCSRA